MDKKVKLWVDDQGHQIPENRITRFEKNREGITTNLHKKAKKLEAAIAEFHSLFSLESEKMYEDYLKEFDVNKTNRKGNFTFFNFNRSIKIEVSINQPIKFDENTIKACKEKLDQFLDTAIENKEDFIKEIIKDAFSTSRGNMDTQKVLTLLKYRDRVKSPLYGEAMTLLEKAIRKPDTKTYFRIWEKDDQGEYKAVNLNFSNL